jgi:uncharacterized protein
MSSFTNAPLSVEQLPRTEDTPLQKLPEVYLRVMHISTAITYSIIATLYTLFQFIPDLEIPYAPWGYALIGALSILGFTANHIKFNYRAYALRQHDILFRSGMLSIRTTVIPRSRIQHVTIQEGPLLRMHSLASLSIFTAGGSTSDLRISGLPRETAVAIKEHLTRKSDAVA